MKKCNRHICKNKVFSFVRNIKIQYRLFAVFLFISLIPTISIGLYAYHVYTRSIHSKISESALQTIRSININMTIELEKFQDYCSTLSVTDTVQQSLRQALDGKDISRDIVISIQQLSITIPFQSAYLKNLRIVSLDGRPVYDRGYDDIPSEKNVEIIENVDAASPRDSLQYIHTYRSQNKLVLGRKLYSVDLSGEPLGYIMVYIDEFLVQDKIFSNVTFGSGSNVMLVDSDGKLLSSQDRSMMGLNIYDTELFKTAQSKIAEGKNIFSITQEEERSTVIAVHNDSFDCYLIASIPQSYIEEETRSINTTLFRIAVTLIVLSLALTFIVYASIVSPIKNIIATCNIASDEDLNVRINDFNRDELGFLARTIDHMVDKIQQLMDRRRKLELKNLQYQINPHFLFNTLKSLQWVAAINNDSVTADGISSLSALLRNTIMEDNEFISLSQELENLRNYFSIQKIRYGNSFDVNYEIAEETKTLLLPRFVLQPLAENAIIHGSKNMPKEILITVSSAVDNNDFLILKVSDNGCGFVTPQKQHKREYFSGIGVNNVIERLQLYYGTEGELSIMSESGKGTVCCIKIPASPKNTPPAE